jgi:hypothetical protein
LRPRDARTAYLNGHAPEQAAAIVMQADRIGPGRDDADWLVALAAADAAKEIKAAAGAMGEKEREELFAALARIEQTGDDLKKQAAAALDSSQIDTKLATIERLARSGKMTNGVAGIVRDIGCFLAGMVASLLAIHFMLGVRVDAAWMIACAGAIGAACATLVLWLAPRIQDAVNSR